MVNLKNPLEYFLSRRIPYGVIIANEEEQCVIKSKHLDFFIKNNYKPILRTLKLSLNIKIKHKNETFIPVEKLWMLFKDKTQLKKDTFIKNIYDKVESNSPCSMPYCICEKLIEWNFQLDEPDGTFIEVERQNKNCYED